MKKLLKKLLSGVGLLGLVYRISCRIGLIKMIPSSFVNTVPIRENREPLVEIVPADRFLVFCPDEERVLVRKTVLDKLKVASVALPGGLKFKILYGYRSLSVQKRFWKEACAIVRQENPHLTDQEVENFARKYSASPTGNGPHQTGGAVDVIIVDKGGTPLDFGAGYRSYSDAVTMHAKSITAEQRKNRKLLIGVMRLAGFSYYPGEWWHYSYGDQMWAAYTGNKFALYGPIKT